MNREQRRAAARAARKPGKPTRRPGPLLSNPVEYVIAGVRTLTPEQRQHLGVRSHGALAEMTRGPGTDQNGADLAAMAEVTFALVEPVLAQVRRNCASAGVGAEAHTQLQVAEAALAIAQQAREAVLAASERAARLEGRWVLTGPELTALNECLELHDQFLEMAPQQLVEHAVVTARGRAVAKRVAIVNQLRSAA